jgi:hypothetical protein
VFSTQVDRVSRTALSQPVSRCTSTFPLDFAEHGASSISYEYDRGNDRVRDHESVACACELEAQSPVDDAQDHEDPTVPDVAVGDESAFLVLEVMAMMDIASEGLEAEERDDDGAEDGVVLVEVLRWPVSSCSGMSTPREAFNLHIRCGVRG